MFSFGDPGYRTLVSPVKRCAFPARIGVPDRVKVLQHMRSRNGDRQLVSCVAV
jgi:hypothetical protein